MPVELLYHIFEWVQNLMNFYWTEEEINSKLENIMTKAFEEVYDMHNKFKCKYERCCIYGFNTEGLKQLNLEDGYTQQKYH